MKYNHGNGIARSAIAALMIMTAVLCRAAGPAPDHVNPANFHPGYYALIQSHELIPSDVLVNDDFVGIKIKYRWRDLEVAPGEYDFSEIQRDLEILENAGKRLWIQIEYVQWNSGQLPSTPEYMWNNPIYGGDPRYYGNYERTVQAGGWYPLFWNSNVRNRLVDLVMAMGLRFQRSAYVEGFSMPETAADRGEGFNCSGYQDTLKQAVVAAKVSFGDKSILQMINYACFDLPQHVAWLNSQGIGIGTPDTYVFKDGLTEVVYPLMKAHGDSIPIGPDVQWANYERNNMSVADIRDFAIESTDPHYMFWRVREPYFSNEVLPAIWQRKLPAAESFYNNSGGMTMAAPKPPVLE